MGRRIVVAALALTQLGYHATGFHIMPPTHEAMNLMQHGAQAISHFMDHAAPQNQEHLPILAKLFHHAPQHQMSHAPQGLLNKYTTALAEHPLPTKMMTGATLAVAGDAIAQQSSPDSNEYDVRRASSFGVFDMAYRALQHAAFPIIVASFHGQFLSSFLPHDLAAAMEQTLASQLGIVPFLYYPAFFALTGAVQGLDAEGSMARAKENFLPLMQRNLLFWIPVQFIQFAFVEEALQIPFLSACGLAWTFILSISAGSAKSYASVEEQQQGVPTVEQLAPISVESSKDVELDKRTMAESVVQ